MNGMPELQVLVVDDEPAIRQVLSAALNKAGYPVESAGSAAEALAKLDKTAFDVVLCDVFMPITDGIELIKLARARGHGATFIMVTAFASVDSAIDAIKAGAWDYITKPVHNEEILRRLEQIDAVRGLREENRTLRRMVMGGDEAAFAFSSPAMQSTDRLITRVAPTDSTVLISGESGTGKGVAARRLHELSSRRDGPFVSVNCGAIPETLIESELFGHTKGAFTSADRARKGLFAQADHGTIFLDEIGELPLTMQTKLLHVLEAKEVRAIGGEATRKIDVRIVAATNRELPAMVREQRFREDLFFRLSMFQIPMPPLRERRSDLPALIKHLLARGACSRPARRGSRSMQKSRSCWWASTGQAMCASWRTCCTARRSSPTAATSMSPTCRPRWPVSAAAARSSEGSSGEGTLRERLRRFEVSLIRRAIDDAAGDRRAAAQRLGIGLSSLYRKLEEASSEA